MKALPTLIKVALNAMFIGTLTAGSIVHADIQVFEAVNDFPIIDAGEVPYYSEAPRRPSLAIDASKAHYRDRFARATLIYDGESGFHDITLTALAELDGEAVYRLLINDVLLGTATNPEVDVDYTPIRHTFEDIVVPHGATIAIESLANTNGKIPEGDGTAFARGRWTTLELDDGDAGQGTLDEVDLRLEAAIDSDDVLIGDVFTVSLDISNSEGGAVATGPRLALTRASAEIALASESPLACEEYGNDIICLLSELAAGDSRSVSVSLQAIAASPNALLRATITTDQHESNPEDNVVMLPLSINASSEEPDQSAPDGETDTDADDTADTDNQTSDGEQTDNQQAGNEALDSESLNGTSGDDTSGNRSGGGALSLWAMLLLLMPTFQRRRKRLRYSPSNASDCGRCRSAG